MAETGRRSGNDGRERGWTEDIDRGRDHDRLHGDRGTARDSGMFGSSGRDRDELERDRGGWGSLWSPNEDRAERDRMRGTDRATRGDDRAPARASSHDDGRPSRARADHDLDPTRARRDDRDRANRTTDFDARGQNRDWDDDDRTAEANRGYGRDDQRSGLPIDETDRLIASNKVEGTAVYGLDGDRLGSIYNFMVDKNSGKVEYAVMTYGGFLGMGTRYYPLPWRLLKYDVRRGGYRVELTARDMERAPSFDRQNEPSFSRDYGERVHNWYGLNY